MENLNNENNQKIFTEKDAEISVTAPAAAAVRTKKFGPLHIAVTCLVLVCALLAGLFVWQLTRTDKLYSFISENYGTDLDEWTPAGILSGNHPLYDDSAVVRAYKNDNDDDLSDKDAYVLQAAASVIDEIITDDMSDYEKELAVYNWQFSYTHYNDSTFAPLGSQTVTADGDTEKRTIGDSSDESAAGAVAVVQTVTSAGNMVVSENTAAADDPVCAEDPYGEDYDYEPYGVLKYGNYICVGNATTFKLFMDMLDIPCQIIHSTTEGEHAWDLVQLDGDWYHVDLTFDNGNENPMYTYFNVPDDAKLDAGYPWDTTEFPAAPGTKYNYALINAVDVSDIYKLPQIIRETIDNDKSSLSVRFDGSITMTENDLISVLDQMSSFYTEAYFYPERLDYITDSAIYMLQFEIYNYDESAAEDVNEEPSYDTEKMSEAISESFSDVPAA